MEGDAGRADRVVAQLHQEVANRRCFLCEIEVRWGMGGVGEREERAGEQEGMRERRRKTPKEWPKSSSRGIEYARTV